MTVPGRPLCLLCYFVPTVDDPYWETCWWNINTYKEERFYFCVLHALRGIGRFERNPYYIEVYREFYAEGEGEGGYRF
jgi:hypothetical protein